MEAGAGRGTALLQWIFDQRVSGAVVEVERQDLEAAGHHLAVWRL